VQEKRHPQKEKIMKNIDEENDDLRPEYDLKSLRVRRIGAARKTINGHKITVGEPIILLAPDVAEIFPDSDSVNEALRFLIRVTRENKQILKDSL
jgi:hypothetical protein